MKYLNVNRNKIIGYLILTFIHLIKIVECVEQENIQRNETEIEKEINSSTEDETYTSETSTIMDFAQQKCHCPCKGVPHSPVCGKTTNGQLKTFDSQCHLICHNQCGSTERYAIIFQHECPVLPITNRKNIYSHTIDDNRRSDHGLNSYSPFITSLEWQCDCSYCPATRWIRFDYYPLCAERGGQKVTFESWCHFDCENKCLKPTGYVYMYLNKGPCEQNPRLEYTEEIIIPRDHRISNIQAQQSCDTCSTRCKDYYEPVCAKNNKDDYLSFKSRCHMRCHIQCYQEKNDSYVEVYEGHCPWLQRTL